MNKLSLAAIAMAICLFQSCSQTNSCETTMEQTSTAINATPQQLEEIKQALNAYVDAAVKGSSEIAKPVFAETATMSFSENGKLVSVPIQALFDYYDQTGPHAASYQITSAHVADDAAIVSIDSKFGPVEFDDMFTLVKDGDHWKIISKIYHVK